MASSATNALTSGCQAMFGLPFFAAGVLAVVRALSGKARPAEAGSDLGMGLLGGVFMLVGGLMLAEAMRAVRAGKRALHLRSEFPAQPWRWNEAWVDGVIAPAGRGSPALVWLLTVICCAVAAVAAIGLWVSPRGAETPLLFRVLFGVGLPLIAATMAVWALRRSLQVSRYGRPRLHLVTYPGVVGGWLRARLDCRVPFGDDAFFEATVRCVRRVRSGSDSEPNQITVWTSGQRLACRAAKDLPGGSRIELAQEIPADTSPSGDDIHWEVEISCQHPGIDFNETWEVPVFFPPDDA